MRGIELLYDKAPGPTSKLKQEYLLEENTDTLPHTPRLSGVALRVFFCFCLVLLLKKHTHTKKKPTC